MGRCRQLTTPNSTKENKSTNLHNLHVLLQLVPVTISPALPHAAGAGRGEKKKRKRRHRRRKRKRRKGEEERRRRKRREGRGGRAKGNMGWRIVPSFYFSDVWVIQRGGACKLV